MSDVAQPPEVDLSVDGPMTWLVGLQPGRSNLKAVSVTCRHGAWGPEMTGFQVGPAPSDAQLVNGAAMNAHRRWGCACYPSPSP